MVFGDSAGKIQTSNISLNDILTRQRDAAENSIALYTSDGRLKPGELVSTITSHGGNIDTLEKTIETHRRDLDDINRSVNTMRRNINVKFFGAPAVISMTLDEIKRALDEQKSINEKVNNFFKDTKINIIYSSIIDDIDKLQNDQLILDRFINTYNKNTQLVDRFFELSENIPASSLVDINNRLNDQIMFNISVKRFFNVDLLTKSWFDKMTLDEIKRAFDEQKSINEKVNNFFKDTKINIIYSSIIDDIDRLKKNQDAVDYFFFRRDGGITALSLSDISMRFLQQIIFNNRVMKFFGVNHSFDLESFPGMTHNEIIAVINKTKIPHNANAVSNIVYTVDSGTFNWVRGKQNRFHVGNKYTGVPGCYRFTIIHSKKFNLEFSVTGISGVNTFTYILDKIPQPPPYLPVGVTITINSSDATANEESLPWIIEFLSGVPASSHRAASLVGYLKY